ncbi:MAG: energy-coupling factor ABC transporter ATP-binding protein, partial [Phascolarctobacterium sp.]
VTHSMEEAVKYANRMLVINAGKVLFDGEPATIFKEHGDELVKVGVDVPQVYKLADLLRQRGLALPEGIKDDMALVKAIKKAKGWK